MTWLLQGTMAGASVGMGCGTCCGTGISAFLFGYLTTHTQGIRQSVRAFLSFYLGKVMAVTALCLTTSLLGTQILDEQGTLFGIHPIICDVVHNTAVGLNQGVDGCCSLLFKEIPHDWVVVWRGEF